MADSVVSWFILFAGGMVAFIQFVRVCLPKEPPKKEYGKVKGMGVNLDWGKK